MVAPVIETLFATVQVYFVFAGIIVEPPFNGVIKNELPLHMVCTAAGIEGLGCTVTVSKKELPIQFPAVGVTRYTII